MVFVSKPEGEEDMRREYWKIKVNVLSRGANPYLKIITMELLLGSTKGVGFKCK